METLGGLDKIVKHSVKTSRRKAERDQLFQKIVTATVTKKPDISKIQTQIGIAIERALLLCAKIKELQTVLVVLCDLHGRLDLGEIGIPFGEDHNGCKILLTSTSSEALSKHMKVDKVIQLSET
ncbi:CC-NBS-LRR resistance protein, putative [Medicago truncatula]|uniref:CC-NBS-LRR resistance protein, putative n=1 Tax=Medicago truncatula TaxID=3880 RepID=A0A072TTC8_MEDTR|nr:CC-NBS-LRR resistance protein, putative [Medicago truncatula]